MNIEVLENKALLELSPERVQDTAQNQATTTLIRIAAYLHDPILYSSSAIHRIFCPWEEGRDDLCATWNEELAVRILTGASLLATFPAGIVASALAIPILCLASAIRDQDFCYMTGFGPEKKLTLGFSLMTWNICCHEGGMNLSTGGMTSWRHRIDQIVKRICERDPDILCLQEVQSSDVALALFDRLKEIYPHFYFNLGIHPLKSNSGLIVFSKFQTDAAFHPFQDAVGWAKHENKGVVSLVVENKVNLCFTHLQYGEENDLEVFDAREKQIGQIVNLMHAKNLPSLVAGDFNLDRYGESFKHSAISEQFDLINEPSPTWSGYYIEKMWKGVPAPPHLIEQSIDYIGRFKNLEDEPLLNIETEYVAGYDTESEDLALSDHHGIFANVTISK